MANSYCVILTTTGSRQEADRLAELLVSQKLAACVQIAEISSVYRWKGEVKHDAEQLLLIKTADHRYADVQAAIAAHHSYEVPEVVQIPISQGLKSYLSWIAENTG